MKIKIFILLPLLMLFGAGCAKTNISNTIQVKEAVQINKTSMTNIPKITHLKQHKDLAEEFNQAILHTNKGDIKVIFYVTESPVTVNNFLNLAQAGFYNGTSFHRVIKNFMIQGGDPNSKDQNNRRMHGVGGPDYKFDDEFNNQKLVRGSLAMANSGPNTNGSQFFIVTAEETPWLDGKHTNFGYVTGGMDVVDSIEKESADANDNPINPVIIKSIELIKK